MNAGIPWWRCCIERIGASIVRWGMRHWLPIAKFALWSLRNPGASFKQFYAESAANSFAINKSHSSLGPNLKPGSLASARRTFDKFIKYGIRPNHTVVDYGCGTLRVGALFIEFLEADRYIGLDLDERILAAGRKQLADEIVGTKRPTLEIITEESLARVAARNPRWVCSNGVLQHVPPDELDEYLCQPISAHSCRCYWLAVFHTLGTKAEDVRKRRMT